MLEKPIRQTIHCLHQSGNSNHAISETLKISRNTVAKVLEEGVEPIPKEKTKHEGLLSAIKKAFARACGNVVRVQEILRDEYYESVSYSTLTKLIRDYNIRPPKRRSGTYHFEPGEEMQHDTSPHNLIIDGQSIKAQCASLVFAYSRKLYIQYYPRFTRFEAKAFLQAALSFMDGCCGRCVIDNTSVILAGGSGADALIAPEMKTFSQIYGFTFFAHAVGHADRKARVERPFYYAETNFLAGRAFSSWDDLNRQAIDWCNQVANHKEKRALGMSPDAAFIKEKSSLKALPEGLPPVYIQHQRVVDSQGFITVDTNSYSVPEKLIGKTLDVYQYLDKICIYHKHKSIAEHPRVIGKRYTRTVIKSHHPTLHRKATRQAMTDAERLLRKDSALLNQYVAELKKQVRGRGIRPLNRLLHFKRTYPKDAFLAAIKEAYHYGLYDLTRLEDLIIKLVAGNYFNLTQEGE